jgi:hypothetical protein
MRGTMSAPVMVSPLADAAGAAALQHDAARTRDLVDAESGQRLQQPVRLLGAARGLDDEAGLALVRDAGVEGPADLPQRAALLRGALHLHQHQLALDAVVPAQVPHADHVHELVELVHDLLDHPVVAAADQRDARDAGELSAAHGQRVDVEPAAGEHAADAREHAGPVLDEAGDQVRMVLGFWFHDSSIKTKTAGLSAPAVGGSLFRVPATARRLRLPRPGGRQGPRREPAVFA